MRPKTHRWASTFLAPLALTAGAAGADPTYHASLLWNNEAVDTPDGTLRSGATYDSMLLAALDARIGEDDAPANGRLHISFLGVRSGLPSANYIGDFQTASNIEAPDATRIYSAWYRQTWAHANSIQAGLIDLNTLFDVTDAAGLLLNASFGLDPTLSGNLPVSTYPEPGYGIVFGRTQGTFALNVGLFQADPTQRMGPIGQGALAIAELDYGYANNLPTQIGIGLWRYRQPNPIIAATSLTGGYINLSQSLNGSGVRHTRAFLRLGMAPGNDSPVPRHLSLGIDVSAPLATRPDDHLSLGMTSAALRGQNTETTYEATYQIALNEQFALQPDFQYITHVSGTDRNASVFILRLQLALD